LKSVALISLVLIFTGIVAAQIPASGPATTQADTQPGAATTVAAMPPDTLPSTLPTTMPVTMPVTMASTLPVASTGPTTSVASTTSTAPATTEAYDTSDEPSTSSRSRSHRSRRDNRSSTTPPPAAAPTGPLLTPRQITREFYPVLSRSIFIKGRQEVIDTGGFSDHFRESPSTTTFASTGPTSGPAPWTPESTLVFNGASDTNGQIVAFIENTGLNTIGRYHLGDAVAQGKLSALTLDSLDYQAASHVTHVLLGQNLQGLDMQVLTTQPVSSTTAPTTSESPGGGADSVLERLRRRRLQELGQ
jgi:hypothetical protein